MLRSNRFVTLAALFLIPITVTAQVQPEAALLKSWAAPLYWQPTKVESVGAAQSDTSSNVVIDATAPPNSLVFVGMTPCRVVDTRPTSGFSGAFGPPNLVGGASRTFPIQSSPNCSIPAIAQAYSFNITVVPPGFLDYITVWPTGQPRPNASTLNGYVNTVIANAAIVPAGTSGAVDVFASQTTDLIIDINGYYAAQNGITLAQGTAAAPSLSFSGDPGTGIFSNGPGILNIGTAGTSRIGVGNGIVSINGLLNVDSGSTQTVAQFINNTTETTIALRNTNTGGREWKLDSSGGSTPFCQGCFTILDTTVGPRLTLDTFQNVQTGSATYGGNFIASSPVGWGDSYRIFRGGNQVGSLGTDSSGAKLQIFTGPSGDAAHARMTIDASGHVGIGTAPPAFSTLGVQGGVEVASSGPGTAVSGFAAGGGVAVYGGAHGAGGVGIWGNAEQGALAAYFNGDVQITGNLTKTSGSFKIDHPLDPANKYLSHSFVESPDMMNIYNGNVTLADDGTAWIELPEWFEALNRDFRYQLTSIGAFSPVFVAEEIRGNRFKIAGGKAGSKVSWQVTGIRRDAYAEAHRIPVEEEKTGKERGRYLYPELYGQPKGDSTWSVINPREREADSND